MAGRSRTTRVAIACQGGGSHTAFTAGVLQGLFERKAADLEIVALSGTSGGAICALLAWDGLLRSNPKRAVEQLQRFWQESSASSLVDAFLNYSIQMAIRMRAIVASPEVSPYNYPTWGQLQLRHMLERRVEFAEARSLAGRPGAPGLLVGAVDVLSGAFAVFRGPQISADCILASAAVPELFPAVALDDHYYWDGLFSQNPPLRELTDFRPDEIWVIQINRTTCDRVPRTVDDISDRLNELSGNLSLEQELRFIRKINELLRRGVLIDGGYRHIEVHRIVMERDLDYASKFDRSESFIRGLMTSGRARAKKFLDERKRIAVP
jgi:NTE family protein